MKKKNKYTFFILLFFLLNMHGQGRKFLDGLVKCDSVNLQIINILNKGNNSGTTSDKQGSFKLAVKEGDSVLFSSLVYINRTIVINQRHINSNKLIVYLEPDYNQLEAVYIDPKLRINYGDFPIGGVIMDRDEMSKRSPTKLNEHKEGVQTDFGVNFIQLFANLTKKGRIARKNRKLEKLKKQRREAYFPDELINIYGNSFFNEYLNVKTEDIYRFLDYCQSSGLSDYIDNNEFQLKDFLLKRSIEFNKLQKD